MGRRIAVSDSVREEAIREAVKELLEVQGGAGTPEPKKGRLVQGEIRKNPVCVRWNYEEKDGPVPVKIV